MKSAVKVLTCDQNDELWDEYFLLLMRRYEDLGLPYPFDMTFSFIGNPIVSGNALIVQTEDSGDTIGAIGFVFGTGEDQYTDDSVCQVEAFYIEPRWRRKVTAMMLLEFIACLYQGQHQVERIQFWAPVERIQFWAPADRPGLHRLLTKFSDCIKTSEKSFGRINFYQTTLERMSAYARRFCNQADHPVPERW